MNMGVHHPYHLDLCADDEDPSQLIIWPGWDASHARCFPRAFYAWPCLLRQVGTVLGSPYDCVVAGLAYANPILNIMKVFKAFLEKYFSLAFYLINLGFLLPHLFFFCNVFHDAKMQARLSTNLG